MKKGSIQKSEALKQSIKSTTVIKKELPKRISLNEIFLMRTLKLLGVTDEIFQKETKCSFKAELFPKSLTNPTSSKQFFFICHACAKNLFPPEEEQQLIMWYPPRTVNEQIEFKKVFFKVLQKLEAHGTVPKNIILSKMVLMGESTVQSVLQFLRILSELSLRALYIEKYSKNDRLIQISVNNGIMNSQNDINKFYVFPFNQTITNVEPPLAAEEIDSIKRILKVYIERYRKRILSLRTVEEVEGINAQSLMSEILEQKQLASTLHTKVSKSIFGQNRAFDRRVILDKNAHTWKELLAIPCNFIEEGDASVLKAEGETSKLLSGWRTVSGTPNLIQLASETKRIKELKSKCQQKLSELSRLRSEVLLMMSTTVKS